jgi:hypothetical protein
VLHKRPEFDGLGMEVIDELDRRGLSMCSGHDEMCGGFDGENGTSREFQPMESVATGMKEGSATASEGDTQTKQINKQSTEKLGDKENTARGRTTKSNPYSITTQILKGTGLSSDTEDGKRREARSGSVLERVIRRCKQCKQQPPRSKQTLGTIRSKHVIWHAITRS